MLARRVENMPYIYELPTSASFRGKGYFGYAYGAIKEKDFDALYVESETGHDTFVVSKKVKRIYYILAGNGHFTIDNHKYEVGPGVLVVVPPRTEYSYSGKMTLLAFCIPRWSHGNDRYTRWNPDVVGGDLGLALGDGSWMTRMVRLKILGKSPTKAYLQINRRAWDKSPSSITALRPIQSYGSMLHTLARIHDVRAQDFSTYFFRNRPELELIRRLLDRKSKSDTLRVAVLGCSTGPEVYSVAWRIKSARPDLRLQLNAVDISKDAVEFGKGGVYSLKTKLGATKIRDCMGAGRWLLGQPDSPLTGAEIFERTTPAEMEELFDISGDMAAVKSSIKEGINWHVGDVREPGILDNLGLHDLVMANNFLCHMDNSEAEKCLRNIARLVSPQGYLFVSGIDLHVRTNVARELGWNPVHDLLEEIHEGDPYARGQWPCRYAGLEPLNKRRQDWKTRYAAVFQIAPPLNG